MSTPLGLKAVGCFLCFGVVMAALAGTTLLWPGTPLDKLWTLNPEAHVQLAALSRAIGVPFLFLSFLLAAAAIGWFRHRLWAWRLAAGIIALQVAGSLINAGRGELAKGSVGTLLAGALLFYLTRPRIRAAFRKAP